MARRLTFGDDRSAGADTAWGWICAQEWPDWRIEVITIEPPLPSTPDSPLGLDELHPWDPPEPRREPRSCRGVEYLTAHHDPRLVLSDRPGSDLVVVGVRGRGLLKALHIGSTAEWLLQSPGTPVVMARSTNRVQRVLVCIDGSGHADRAVEALADMPWLPGVQVRVLGIEEGLGDLRADAERAANLLTQRGAEVIVEVKDIDPTVLTVHPRADILNAINASGVDLVVLGTRGRTGAARVWLGSVAGAVAHQAPCSVLLARGAASESTS